MRYLFLITITLFLFSCKKNEWKDLVPQDQPTKVSSIIEGEYLYFSDQYNDGVGWNNRDGSFIVTDSSFIHDVMGYREILYYPDHPNWFRLHDTTVNISQYDHFAEEIIEFIEYGKEGIENFILFRQLNDNEDRHIRWYY